MAEEYVYKIVIDDGDVNKTIDSIDSRVVELAKKMDAAFKNVGKGTVAGSSGGQTQKMAQQAEQAAARVTRAEQQKAQQIVKGQQQIDQAKRRSFKVVDEEFRTAQKSLDAAKKKADQHKQILDGRVKDLEEANSEYKRIADEFVAGSKEAGPSVPPTPIGPGARSPSLEGIMGGLVDDFGARRVDVARQDFEVAQGRVGTSERESAKYAAEAELAQISFDKIAKERAELTSFIDAQAQQQHGAEVRASQQTVAAQASGQQQTSQLRQKSITEINKALAIEERRIAAAKVVAEAEKAGLEKTREELRLLNDERKRAIDILSAAKSREGAGGGDPVATEFAEENLSAITSRVKSAEGRVGAGEGAVAAAEAEVAAAEQGHARILQSRKNLENQAIQSAQRQQQVEIQAAQQSASQQVAAETQVASSSKSASDQEVQASHKATQSTNEEIAALDAKIAKLKEAEAAAAEDVGQAFTKLTSAEDVHEGARTEREQAQQEYFATKRGTRAGTRAKINLEDAGAREEATGEEFSGAIQGLQEAEAQLDSHIEQLATATEARRQLGEVSTQAAQEGAAAETTAAEQAQSAFEQKAEAGQWMAESREQAAQRTQQADNQEAAAGQAAAEALMQGAQQQQAVEAQLADVSQQTGEARMTAARNAVQGSGEIVQARQTELASAQSVLNVAKVDADAAKRTAQVKKRASQDAAETAKEAAEIASEASGEEKEAAEQAAAARQEEANVAKAASIEASRVSEDAAKRAKRLGVERGQIAKQVTAATKLQSAAERELRNTTTKLAQERRAAVKAEREAERSFIRTTKTFIGQRKELDQLAQKHGSFNVTLGKSRSSMNALEKEVDDIIRADKQLSAELDKLIAKQKQFNVTVDRQTFRGGPQAGIKSSTYRQAGFAAQRVGLPGAAALGEAAAVAGPIGIGIAAALLGAQQLIKVMSKIAGAAKEAFEAIVRGSVAAAKEIEVARAQFTAFFQGDTQAAEAALGRLQQISRELGENVVGIGRAFLPEVEDLDQLEEVTKIAVALARFQPEQGILGARIALQEALAGEFRSLQRRFEISPVAIDKIREAFATGGVTSLLEELQAELSRTGRSVEDLSDTFAVSVGRLQERWRQFQQQLGAPIIDELKDQFSDIDDELERLSPDLDAFADALGEVLAKLVDIIGTEIEDFLENFDPEPLVDVATALFGVVDAFGIMLAAFNGGEGAAAGIESALFSLAESLLNVEEYFLNAALSILDFRENLQDIAPIIGFIGDAEEFALKNLPLSPGGFVPGQKAVGGAVGAATDAVVAFAETGPGDREAIEEAIAGLEERKVLFRSDVEGYFNSIGSASAQGEKAANVFLVMSSALDELIVLQKEYEETQLKVNEAVNEFNIQAQLKFEKILTDATRKRLKFEIEAAQKTIDIERKNAQKVADIRSSYDQNILGAAVDLTDKEADILRKHSDSVLDLEDDLNDKRIEVEEKYLEELERLRDRFNFQAFEAILANDGKKLRQIRRQQAFEEQQAEKNRDKGLNDVDDDIEDRRQKLEKALEREIRDARIANARKIRDLATSLDEQLAKQDEARRRDLESQAISERRKRNELNAALDQQLEDYRTWWDERARVTSEKIADDLEALRNYVSTASDILNELSALGIVFDPVTGQPELAYSQPAITDPISPGLQEIQDIVFDFEKARLIGLGGTPDDEAIRAQVEALDIEDLVDALEDFQDDAIDLSPVMPEGSTVWDQLERTSLDTSDLVHKLLMEQALFLGAQVGVSAEDIVNQTLGLSMGRLAEWVDDFTAKYKVHELPDFSIFGSDFEGSIFQQPGGMSEMPPQGMFGEQPGLSTPIPPDMLGSNFPFAPVPTGQEPLVSGVFGATGSFGPTVAGLQPGQLGTQIPQAVAGQTQFIFPAVTDAPYLMPDMASAPPVQYAVPQFGQALSMPSSAADQQFLPGNIAGVNPSYGFDAAAFTAQVDAQVAEFVVGEMVKRGEVSDTVAFAELMIEKQTLGLNALLGSQVDEYQIMSDEQIAILEETLRRQQEALGKLQEDSALEEETKVTEQAIAQLEEVLERQRTLASEANLAILQQETDFIEDAEESKQVAIGDTLVVATDATAEKKRVVTAGLDDETAAAQTAALEQAGVVRAGEAEEAQIRLDGRDAELEEEEEHIELRLGQLQTGFGEESGLLGDFWNNWTSLEAQGASQDLRILAAWIDERNRLLAQASTVLPGLAGLPEDEEDGGSTGGFQATLQELQILAVNLAGEYGLGPAAIGDIQHMSYDEIVEFIDWLQGELGYRALGGSFQPNQPLIVGETGPELIPPMGFTGQVYPLRDMLFRTPPTSDVAGGVTVNKTMENTITLPDPRGIPPSYIRMMENVATRVVRRSWSGS